MTTRRVMIEMRTRGANLAEMVGASAAAAPLPSIEVDSAFGAVAIPSRSAAEYGSAPSELTTALELAQPGAGEVETTYLIRGKISERDESSLEAAVADPANPVVGVYADVPIQPFITCGGTPAVGDDKTVERLLCVAKLQEKGMTGEGVMVAIVDTGINLAHLHAHGKDPVVNAALSWMPRPGLTPFNVPVNHGTMCAFDVCIAAPKCTLLDIGVLLSQAPGGTAMEGLLSDAVRAYSHLRTVLKQPNPPRALVVSNSWGMFNPSWDYPVGHPGNYSDNPDHPFNRIVGTLEKEGADILFAAGNCGSECPDGRCGGVTNSIYGANSAPHVLSIAGVDTNKQRVGYSTKGPGRLSHDKPDVSGYTHFLGSHVYPVDSGTSAATPVVAGLVAAIRTKFAYNPHSPATWPIRMRQLLERTAIDGGAPGYDLEYGHGIVDGCKLAQLTPTGGSSLSVEPRIGSKSSVGSEASIPSTDVPASVVMAGGVSTGFVRLSVDSHPGSNTHILQGLPAGTRSISLWVTEWKDGNLPWAGDAVLSTFSVQLFDNGRKCRFIFNSSWGSSLPVAAQYLYG